MKSFSLSVEELLGSRQLVDEVQKIGELAALRHEQQFQEVTQPLSSKRTHEYS